jgi:hypothetical protein
LKGQIYGIEVRVVDGLKKRGIERRVYQVIENYSTNRFKEAFRGFRMSPLEWTVDLPTGRQATNYELIPIFAAANAKIPS